MRARGPPPGTRRWTARRKAQVVDAVAAGGLTLEAARRAYDLSPEELAAWKRALDRYGMEALKVTHGREFRSAAVPTVPSGLVPTQLAGLGRSGYSAAPHGWGGQGCGASGAGRRR